MQLTSYDQIKTLENKSFNKKQDSVSIISKKTYTNNIANNYDHLINEICSKIMNVTPSKESNNTISDDFQEMINKIHDEIRQIDKIISEISLRYKDNFQSNILETKKIKLMKYQLEETSLFISKNYEELNSFKEQLESLLIEHKTKENKTLEEIDLKKKELGKINENCATITEEIKILSELYEKMKEIVQHCCEKVNRVRSHHFIEEDDHLNIQELWKKFKELRLEKISEFKKLSKQRRIAREIHLKNVNIDLAILNSEYSLDKLEKMIHP